MDIEKMTIEELKVLGYDQAVLLEQTSANLQLIRSKIGQIQTGSITKTAKGKAGMGGKE